MEETDIRTDSSMDRDNRILVSEEPLERLASTWPESMGSLQWRFPFVLPGWLKAWWDAFGQGWEPCVLSARSSGRTIGIAPLRLRGKEARFIGDVNVSDYLDFVTEPGREEAFLMILVDHLRRLGIRRLDLRVLRPDSTAIRFLPRVARSAGCEMSIEQEDVTYEIPLPATWDDYLSTLSGHQRHEIRRKLRRFEERGSYRLTKVEEPEEVSATLDTFMDLFRSSRADKEAFMDRPMALFFRSMTRSMAACRTIRFHLLETDGNIAAALLCFDHSSTTYLYNNGFHRSYASLSIGIVSKVLSIKDCIEQGRKVYDLLKGAEPYKHHLGGKPVPLFRCRIRLL